tara:strand:- start:17 stop:688 length:672 start_codon:yes stop_codon:yes gene_type:complete
MSNSIHGVLHVLDSTSGKSRPLTLASNVLSVDASGTTVPVSITSVPLATGAATSALQTTGNASLTNIESSLSSTLVVDDTTAQGHLSNIENSLTSTLVVEDITAQGHLSNIETSLAGTLTVTSSVTKAETTVSSAAAVTNGSYSSSHDCSSQRKIIIMGSTTDSSNNIDIHVSQDDTTYYKLGNFSIYPDNGAFASMFDAPYKYVKLRFNSSATVTAIIAGSN